MTRTAQADYEAILAMRVMCHDSRQDAQLIFHTNIRIGYLHKTLYFAKRGNSAAVDKAYRTDACAECQRYVQSPICQSKQNTAHRCWDLPVESHNSKC